MPLLHGGDGTREGVLAVRCPEKASEELLPTPHVASRIPARGISGWTWGDGCWAGVLGHGGALGWSFGIGYGICVMTFGIGYGIWVMTFGICYGTWVMFLGLGLRDTWFGSIEVSLWAWHGNQLAFDGNLHCIAWRLDLELGLTRAMIPPNAFRIATTIQTPFA